MVSIKDITDMELLDHITVNQESLEPSEYGSADYNSVASELTVAHQERKRRIERRKREDKRVNITLQEVDQEYSIPSYLKDNVKCGITRALKQINSQKDLLNDLMMEQLETM